MNRILFPGLPWFLFLLVPLAFFGFYPNYFSRLFSELPSIFHVHAFFMTVWIGLAICQPLLIRYKKTNLHRKFGRASYVIMPLVFASAYWMIRYTYNKQLETGNTSGEFSTPEAIQNDAAVRVAIGVVYLLWLMIYYGLAVYFRKKMLYHATFMFAAILTLLGPTLDRIIYFASVRMNLADEGLLLNVVFILTSLLLAGLLLYQWRKGHSIKPAGVVLGIHAAGLLVFFLAPGTRPWSSVINLLF